MAHGYLEYFGNGQIHVYSAGIETHGVNPRAIAVMKEENIDISCHTSNHVSEYEHIDFDFVITVCDNAKENCPYFPARIKILHHNFPDPAKVTGSEEVVMQEFRNVRDMIRRYTENFTVNYVNVTR
jgi:arsenate reductase